MDGGAKISNKSNKKNKSNKLKIFDLSKKSIYQKGDLQNNLKQIHHKYGGKFTIKFNPSEKDKKTNDNKKEKNIISVDVVLQQVTMANGITFYRLTYDIPNRTTEIVPIKINFIDDITLKLNNISYISNISRTDDISGTNMVKLCLKINEVFGVEKTRLHDGASVNCNDNHMDLSFLKLLENEMTFYMKLGFDFEITGTEFMFARYSVPEDLKNAIDNLIEDIRSIKISDIIAEYTKLLNIINIVVREHNKNNLVVLLKDIDFVVPRNASISYHKKNPYESIPELFNECFEMLNILNDTEHTYLYKLMIELFNDKIKCSKYVKLFMYLIETHRYKIIYGKHELKCEHVIKFKLLQMLRYNYYYCYIF